MDNIEKKGLPTEDGGLRLRENGKNAPNGRERLLGIRHVCPPSESPTTCHCPSLPGWISCRDERGEIKPCCVAEPPWRLQKPEA